MGEVWAGGAAAGAGGAGWAVGTGMAVGGAGRGAAVGMAVGDAGRGDGCWVRAGAAVARKSSRARATDRPVAAGFAGKGVPEGVGILRPPLS